MTEEERIAELSYQKTNKTGFIIAAVVIFILACIAPIGISSFYYASNKAFAETFDSFDVNGYIQNQNLTAGFHYGLQTSDKSGCGWIATYNALVYLKNEGYYDGEIVIEDLIRVFANYGTFAYGYLGTNPLVIKYYLEGKGFKVNIVTNRDNFVEAATNSLVNISLYVSKKFNYGHYQMFEKTETYGQFWFANPVELLTIDEFIMNHPIEYLGIITINNA
ncbi:MAG: hypothetical protein AB7S44_02865 [Spirochaetales bacterium]